MSLRLRGLRRAGCALLAVLMLLALGAPGLAAAPRRVVKVGVVPVKGLTERAEDGTRHGLVVDYLNEIAKYTGWEYEYVDVTSDDLLSAFAEGKFELMGGNYYIPGLEKSYAYPKYNAGYSKAVLLALRDDQSMKSYDLNSLNGKTIGVYERAEENIRRLKEFLRINNLNCTLKPYTYEELSEDGNLYPRLKSGEVDLLLGNSLERDSELRVVASYDSQPYYIVTNVGNQEILDGLNMALERILDANPNFGAERYAANFTDTQPVDIQLSREELDYVRQRGAVKVAVTEEWHPLFCLNLDEDLHNGMVPDVLNEIAAFTGLEFSYVYAETYGDALRMVEEGQADLLGFFLGTEEDSVEQGLALTDSYGSLSNIVLRNKLVSYPGEGLTGAVVQGRKLPNSVVRERTVAYPTITEAIAAVDRGEADFVYGLSARIEQDLQGSRFTNLVPVALVNENTELCFAMPRPVESLLFSILDKAINTLPSEKKSSIVNQNMVSIGVNRLTLADFIYANPMTFVTVVSVILLLLAALALLVGRARMRAAVMRSELEQAEAESRAKGEFLSRMSHEIRTPMNAVVGLADLTDMMEDVPREVHENLSKIRSSSRYLLSLINDILDMSRIDGGMLSIAHEPFSLERMLDELQSMMDAEARRRGLAFTLESSLSHGDLTGDVIRLRQVLTNLLSNAFKFTPAGGSVRLRVTEDACTQGDATFTFQVLDTGVGIRPEDQRRIFDSFEQVGPSSAKSQGTGLGLSISRRIVQLMGGELRVKSEPGRGSEFYFTVTLDQGPRVAEPERDAAGETLEGARILLAEDNDLNAEIAVQLLEVKGAQVCRTEDGRQVLERFEASRPGEFQLILMDIHMPQMTGLEATRAIRALERPDAATIPIVAMTANAFKEDADAATAAGMNGFVSKPLDVNYLYALLHDLLRPGGEG